MTRAPLLGRLLLRVAVPRADHDFVAGDLLEEYRDLVVPRVGAAAARRWYMSQAVRSIYPFALLRVRRMKLRAGLLRAQLLVTVPLFALHLLWTAVLSAVPLRADAVTHASAAMSAAIMVAIAVAGSLVAGVRFGGDGSRSPLPLALGVLLATAVLTNAPAVSRFVAPAVLLTVLPLAVLGTALIRTAFRPLAGARRIP